MFFAILRIVLRAAHRLLIANRLANIVAGPSPKLLDAASAGTTKRNVSVRIVVPERALILPRRLHE